MTDPGSHRVGRDNGDEITLLALATIMLRGRRTILSMAAAGLVLGVAFGLLMPRTYTSTATFIPQDSEEGGSDIARAASQLGFNISNGSGGWGPAVYVELLQSRVLLEPIAVDTLQVPEEGGKRIAVSDLLDVSASGARKTDLTVRALGDHIAASEEKSLNGVKLSVTTKWPSVSYTLAERLVSGVGRFNVERRKSQAAAERQLVENLANEAAAALRASEDELQAFLQRNRGGTQGSPQLAFDRDRLQRQVDLRQQIYTSLLQNREQARIREVRDTPVITVLEDPRLPVVPESRKVVMKGIFGLIGGTLLGMLVAFLAQGLAGARIAPNKEEREFFELLAAATPRFRRRRAPRERAWSAGGDQ